MRILALVPGGIGDQILFFPTIDNLKGRYPEAEIDVVVEPRATAAYRVSKSVDKEIPFDFKDVNGKKHIVRQLKIPSCRAQSTWHRQRGKT